MLISIRSQIAKPLILVSCDKGPTPSKFKNLCINARKRNVKKNQILKVLHAVIPISVVIHFHFLINVITKIKTSIFCYCGRHNLRVPNLKLLCFSSYLIRKCVHQNDHSFFILKMKNEKRISHT